MNKNLFNINQQKQQQNNEQIVNNNMPEICQTDNSLKLKIINVRSLASPTPSPTRSPIKPSSQMHLAAASSSSTSSVAATLASNRNDELIKNDINFCNKIFGIAKVQNIVSPEPEKYIEIDEGDEADLIEDVYSAQNKKSDRTKIIKHNRSKRKFDRSELAKYAKYYNQMSGKIKPTENISTKASTGATNVSTDIDILSTNSTDNNYATNTAAYNKQHRRKPVHQPLNDEMIIVPPVNVPKHLHATRFSARKTIESLNPGKKNVSDEKKFRERMDTVLSVKTTNSDAMTHLAFLRVCANVIMQEFGRPQIKFSKNRNLEYLLKKFYQRK